MTRDEQRKLKILKKALPQITKARIKEYKLKKADYKIWFCKKGLFFDLLLDVRTTDDGLCICTATEKIKPLWIDILLWDFLKMESNRSAPLSLRATGAFTVDGSKVYEAHRQLEHWDISELEVCVETYLEHFYQTILSATVDDFIENMDASPYHAELRRAFTLIHAEKYQEALDYLNTFGDGVFQNEGISINNAIREYCRKKCNNGQIPG